MSSVSIDVSSAREKLSERASFDAARDLGHLGGDVKEGSRDLSDLLGSSTIDDAPRAPKPSSPAPARSPLPPRPQSSDDFFADALGDVSPSKAAPAPMCVPAAPVSEAPVVAMHYGGAGGTPTKRKVAATKISKDAPGFDDWGDDW